MEAATRRRFIEVVLGFEYTNPTHHGTPMERVSAITNGFDLAAAVDKLDVAFGAGRF